MSGEEEGKAGEVDGLSEGGTGTLEGLLEGTEAAEFEREAGRRVLEGVEDLGDFEEAGTEEGAEEEGTEGGGAVPATYGFLPT
jgi:hypothetical protein